MENNQSYKNTVAASILEEKKIEYTFLKQYECKDLKTLDFTAIDFETASLKGQFPCQVGLVLVEGGKVIRKIARYIKPPQNEYSPECMQIHRITPDITVNEPEFNTVWDEIKPYIANQFIVAHNASFDMSVLEKALKYYNIEIPVLKGFLCTKTLFGGVSLKAACSVLNVSLPNHHDGLCDATACANLYLTYIHNGVASEQIQQMKKMKTNKQLDLFPTRFSNKHKSLKGEVLQKDLSNADPDNPFYDRKIVVTGIFTQERKELGKILKSMGADIDTCITRKTNFVLVGDEPGPKKIEKLNQLILDGYSIRILYQIDLDKILNREYEGYFVKGDVKKDLTLSLAHLRKKRFIKENPRFNLFAKKQCYIGKELKGEKFKFFQLLGNLGAEVDEYIYEETDVCIISESTFNNLKSKTKDETITYIENTYNNNKSISFHFVFITESQFLTYYKNRMELINDPYLTLCYEQYVNSEKILIF